MVTVGRDLDPASLGPQPTNVHIRRYIPQNQLLPHCDLVISHAGSGSVIGALAHGLPMVLLPMGADQPLNATRAKALNVAVVLDAMAVTAANVHQAAKRVTEDGSYRENAERIRDEIRALPGPEHAVNEIEQIHHHH